MSQWQEQIQANANAIQLMLDDAKQIKDHNALGVGISNLDRILIQLDSNDDTVYATREQLVGTIFNPIISGEVLGDLLVYNGTQWINLAAGIDGEILSSDSGEPTGLKWITDSGIPTLQQVADIGNTTTTFLRASKFEVGGANSWLDIVSTELTLQHDGQIDLINSTNGTQISLKNGNVSLSSDGSQFVNLQTNLLTADRTYDFANISGIIPMTVNGVSADAFGNIEVTGLNVPITTKGDIYTFSTVEDRLAVGTNGQVLTADSGESTGLKWTSAGAGDMVLASVQTVTGNKTFEDGTMILRNVADTFDGVFVNTNTADRIYTLQDSAGTLAFLTDITGDPDQTFANTSDANSHTLTLSGSGGSIKLIEGTNITLTTTGTGLNGIVTIASVDTGATQLSELSDVNTSTPTDKFFLIADGVDWESRLLVIADVSDFTDNSTTWDALVSNITTNLSLGAITATTMIVVSSDGSDVTLIEADTDDAGLLGADKWDEIVANTAKVTNSDQTFNNTSDATSHTVTLSDSGGSFKLIEGSNITLTTTGTSLDGIITIASTGGGATQLTDLTDVNTATITNRFVLVADGVDFESRLLIEADISDLGTYLTDNETITLSGDVSGSGTTTITTTIEVDAVDIPMLSATGTPDSTTFLRGDNQWVVPSGSGDVSKVGTPVDNEIGVWTGDGTIEGDTNFQWDGNVLTLGNAKAISSAQSLNNTLLFQAYDVNGTFYVTFATLTSHNTPTFDLENTVTYGGTLISVVGHTHTLSDGATDVTSTFGELNLLDLSGLTTGWVLSADSATTASWKAQTGGGDDVSTFPEKSGALVGADRLVGLSGATDFSETISGIPLSIFNDDLGHTENVTTNLTFSRNATTVTVISSDGTDAVLPEADTTNAGILGSDKWDEIVANTLKNTNVSTDLSMGTVDGTQYIINSSDGNNVSLPLADTNNWGIISDEIFDEIVVNNAKVGFLNLTGHITSTGAATLLGSFTLAQLDTAMGTTGTATASTFLRGDNSWQVPGGSGDMVLADAQTVTGIKTFEDGTIKLENVAGTFDGYFVNTNTADRIYTLPDLAGTVMLNLVEDTSPQLGANLDLNGFAINNVGSPGHISIQTNGNDNIYLLAGQSGTQHVRIHNNSTHTASQNAGLYILQDGSGDAILTFDAGAQEFTMGVDNSVSGNPFEIHNGASLNSTPDFRISNSGVLSAHNMTPAEITTQGDTALITKEYGDANYGGGGAMATDVLWDAAGDLAVGTGADTGVKLTMGSTLQYLRVNAGATALEWATLGAGGDMVLADAQEVSGIKTFLDTTMKLRNVADTFDGYFVNTNTANRIYTLQDSAGTLAFVTRTIVNITGTKVQFDTSVTDGDFLYVGDVTSNVTTNLTFSRNATTVTVESSDGTDAVLPEADTTNAGILGSDKWDEIVASTTHLGDATIHFTEASISIPLTQGANDVTATFGELNLLDLSGLTVDWVLSADSATTASWKSPTGGSGIGGSITDNQIAVGASVADDIEGDSNFSWDGSDMTIYKAVNDGNPSISIGSTVTNSLKIQAIYFGGTQEIDRFDFITATTSATANHGRFIFWVDEIQTLAIDDSGINLNTGKTLSINSVEMLSATALSTTVVVDMASITALTATAAELNILDLSATSLTTGWGYFADGASTASWRQLLGSEISNTEGWTGKPSLSRSVTIIDPVAGDDLTLFFTPVAITITDVRSHITGTTNVIFNIQHASTRTGSGLDVFTSDITLTSTAGQSNNSGFNDETIPANSWVWLEIISVSATPNRFHTTLIFTED